MKSRGAFTLIELLVVIAIIAILAAILFPVFVGAREKARQTACLSNMSQLGKAFRMYLDDSNGMFPHGAGVYEPASHNRVSDGDWIWFKGAWPQPYPGAPFRYDGVSVPWPWKADPSQGAIWKYTNKSLKVFMCPSDQHSVRKDFTWYGGFGLSYTMNCALVENEAGYGDTSAGTDRAIESQLLRPSKTVMLCDQGDGCRPIDSAAIPSLAAYDGRIPCIDGTFIWFITAPSSVHVGGQNWVFCDGHAKWCSLKQFRDLAFRRDGIPGTPEYKKYQYRWTD
jgi:prepilin-type N-terminal cleavage/methylation domain-containing protein